MPGKKILFVLTSTAALGNTGHKTGAYLSEITHAYDEFTRAGYEIDMISPQGGKAPLDGVAMDDPINATWMNDEEFLGKIETTQTPWQVQSRDYVAIYFAGGHGAMFDLVDNLQLHKLVADIYENSGVIGAVCHGVAGLVDVRKHGGQYLLKDHEVACFTNEEEEMVGMEKAVPFLLQNRVQERGASHTSAPKFVSHVVKSGRVVTGQNPASAADVAKGMLETLHFVEEGRWVPDQNWCEWEAPHMRPEARGVL